MKNILILALTSWSGFIYGLELSSLGVGKISTTELVQMKDAQRVERSTVRQKRCKTVTSSNTTSDSVQAYCDLNIRGNQNVKVSIKHTQDAVKTKRGI